MMRYAIKEQVIWTQDLVEYVHSFNSNTLNVIYWLKYDQQSRLSMAKDCGYKFGFVITKIK